MTPVFPLYYFPGLLWCALALRQDQLWLDASQPYKKQQFHSRACVRTPGGMTYLTIPVVKRSSPDPIGMKNIRYDENWPRKHLRTLETCYSKSPYFHHFYPELQALFANPPEWLGEWNLRSIAWLLTALGWRGNLKVVPIAHPYEFQRLHPLLSGRNSSLSECFSNSYPQVFDGFVSGVSGLDILFNLGPGASDWLRRSLDLPPLEAPYAGLF